MEIVTKEDYWTTILNDPTKFGQITTEDPKFNEIADYVWNVLENSFIKIDDEESIIQWENTLDINGEGLSDLERKINILYKLTIKEYFPISLFTQALDKLIGEGNYELFFNSETQKYYIECYNEHKKSLNFLNKRLAKNEIVMFFDGVPGNYIRCEFLQNKVGGSNIIMPMTDVGNTSPGFEIEHDIQFLGTKDTIWGFGLGGLDFWRVLSTGFNLSGSIAVDDIKKRRIVNFQRSGGITRLIVDGKSNQGFRETISNTDYGIFYIHPAYAQSAARLFYMRVMETGLITRKLYPAINEAGEPCLFDMISRSALKGSNPNSFIVGLNKEQAVNLSQLPIKISTITISLPEDYESDSNVILAIENARRRGWTLTIQTHDENYGYSSTYGIKRIWVRKIKNENGFYTDKNGERYQVDWCIEIYSPDNKTPKDFGYEQFRSVDSALSYWELTPYIHPELEQVSN